MATLPEKGKSPQQQKVNIRGRLSRTAAELEVWRDQWKANNEMKEKEKPQPAFPPPDPLPTTPEISTSPLQIPTPIQEAQQHLSAVDSPPPPSPRTRTNITGRLRSSSKPAIVAADRLSKALSGDNKQKGSAESVKISSPEKDRGEDQRRREKNSSKLTVPPAQLKLKFYNGQQTSVLWNSETPFKTLITELCTSLNLDIEGKSLSTGSGQKITLKEGTLMDFWNELNYNEIFIGCNQSEWIEKYRTAEECKFQVQIGDAAETTVTASPQQSFKQAFLSIIPNGSIEEFFILCGKEVLEWEMPIHLAPQQSQTFHFQSKSQNPLLVNLYSGDMMKIPFDPYKTIRGLLDLIKGAIEELETRPIYHAKLTLELTTKLSEMMDDRTVFYGITPVEWVKTNKIKRSTMSLRGKEKDGIRAPGTVYTGISWKTTIKFYLEGRQPIEEPNIAETTLDMALTKLLGRKPEHSKLVGPFDEDNQLLDLETTFGSLKTNKICYGVTWEKWTVIQAYSEVTYFLDSSNEPDIGKNTMKLYLPGGNQAIFAYEPKRAILFYVERQCELRNLPAGLPLRDIKHSDIPKNTTCEAMKRREACYGIDILEWLIYAEVKKGNKVVKHITLETKPSVLDRLQFIDDLVVINSERREQKKLASLPVTPLSLEKSTASKKKNYRNSMGNVTKDSAKEKKDSSPSMKDLIFASPKVRTPRGSPRGSPNTPTQSHRNSTTRALVKNTDQRGSPSSIKKLQFVLNEKEPKDKSSQTVREWHNQKDCHLPDLVLFEKYSKKEPRYHSTFANPFKFESELIRGDDIHETRGDADFNWSESESSNEFEGWKLEMMNRLKQTVSKEEITIKKLEKQEKQDKQEI